MSKISQLFSAAFTNRNLRFLYVKKEKFVFVSIFAFAIGASSDKSKCCSLHHVKKTTKFMFDCTFAFRYLLYAD